MSSFAGATLIVHAYRDVANEDLKLCVTFDVPQTSTRDGSCAPISLLVYIIREGPSGVKQQTL